MKRISQVIIKICVIILLFQFMYIPLSYASFWGDIFKSGDEFLNEGKKSSGNVINGDQVEDEFNKIYNILFAIGVALSVIVGAILGIKFMVGSVEEQAKIKETLIPYVIGCVIIFGAFGIWKLLVTLLSSI